MSVAEDLNALIAELATGPSTARRRELVFAARGLVKELATQRVDPIAKARRKVSTGKGK